MLLPKQTPAVIRNSLENFSLQSNSVRPNQIALPGGFIDNPTIIERFQEIIQCQFNCEINRQSCLRECTPPINGSLDLCPIDCQLKYFSCFSGCS